MRSLRSALVPLALLLLGPALLCAQEQPLAAGSDGVPVPKKKKHVQPIYPQEALAKGIRGIVILDLVIDSEGQVAEMHVIRSIPGLDEAALAAARQWRYDPVEVDGRPVSVRLTVPITFALKLPELSRDRGIPEIRQGVTPAWPEDTRGGGQAAADITLDPDGRIGMARILEGQEPWSSSLLQALRTWRFRTPPEDASVSFRVEAEFVPGPGSDPGRVELRLTGLRETALLDAPEEEPAAMAALEPAGEPEEPATMAATLEPAGEPEEPAGTLPGSPEEPDPSAPGTAESGPEAPTPPNTAPPTPAAEPAAPATPTVPGAGPAVAASGSAPATGAAPGGDPTAPPPIEVIRAAPPPPPPPENGISAIRGVLLDPGVPDLTRGRRPVAPPFARMGDVSGVVEVDFSVSAGGITAVLRVDGPELLRAAATQAVESWIFRRTRADRAYLTAVFTYEDDLSSAVVKPQPAP